MFADAAGALWSAALTVASVGWAMVFTCVTDARQPVRALALAEVPHAAELTEGVLREWLTRAPRLGPLP